MLKDIENCFNLADTCIRQFDKLNNYFDLNKRGKNTSKKEKIELCNNIKEEDEINSLSFLVNFIYNYRLFELDINYILLHKKEFLKNIETYSTTMNESDKKNPQTSVIIDNLDKIDIKLFKRFINIFTLNHSNKNLKSNIEVAICYKLFKMILINLKEIDEKQRPQIDNIDELTIDLNNIWKF
jgi:hypothetical protein